MKSNLTFVEKGTRFLVNYSALIVLAVLIVVFGTLSPSAFFSLNNLQNIFVQASPGGVVALALTITMIVGEFDLSVGYMASLAGLLVFGFMVNHHDSFILSVFYSLGATSLLGLISGLIVSRLKVNAFIGTLGIGFVAVGIVYSFSNGALITGKTPHIVDTLGLGSIIKIQNLTLVWICCIAILWVVTERTPLGVHMRAIGGQARAAELVGLPVAKIRMWAFVCSAFLAGFGGIMLSMRLGSGQPNAGNGYLLDGFSATFLGRGFYRAGEFSVPGTVVGALILQVGYNGLAIIGMPTAAKYYFSGGTLVVALALGTIAGSYHFNLNDRKRKK
jgi:ribose transport system permease protein